MILTYAEDKDLPDGVKDKMPPEAMTVWRGAYNKAAKEGMKGEDCEKKAWAALKEAGWKKGDDGMFAKDKKPEPMGQKKHTFDAEVFATGTWKGDDYTIADLDDMVKNFALLGDSVKPPVKLGHNRGKRNTKNTSDGQPAMGWVSALRRNGNKLIATLTEVPDLVYRAVRGNLYKRVSSEIYWNLKKGGRTFTKVLSGVALLGADIPAVDVLEDLQAFLSQNSDIPDSFEKVACLSLDIDGAEKIIEGSDDMDKLAEKEVELTAEREAREKAEKEAKLTAEKLEKFEAEQKTERQDGAKKAISEYFDGKVKEGVIPPAMAKLFTESLEDKEILFTEDDKAVAFSFETVQKVFDLAQKVLPTEEKGAGGGGEKKEHASAGDEVAEKAAKYAKEHEVDLGTATTAVLRENPDLAKTYTEEELSVTDDDE